MTEGQHHPHDSDFLNRLQTAVEARQGRKRGTEIRFLCPAHDDHRPSARYNPDKAVWYCDACGTGGGAYDLASRLGIEAPQSKSDGLTVDVLAAEKGLSAAFLRDLGVRDGIAIEGTERRRCVDIPYMDASGEEQAVHKRLRLTGERRFKWRRGDKVLPYGLSRLDEARRTSSVVLVEGESDSWTLWHAGIPALGIPGASTWKDEWTAFLEGIATVALWREPGKGGDTLATMVAGSLPEVRIIVAPPDAKDASALWLSVGCDVDAFQARMRDLAQSARPASELRAEALSREAKEDLEQSDGLLDDPALLHRLVLASEAQGHVGDRENIAVGHLAIATYPQPRLASVIVKGPASSGKNHLFESVLPLWPEGLFIRLSAGSERWLVYSEEEFSHRFIFFAEARAVEESFGAYLVRTLLSEGRLSYRTVDKAEQGLTGRVIEKDGPTGLIATTTQSALDEQLETRCWTIESQDSDEYIQEAMRAIARRRSGTVAEPQGKAERAALRYLHLTRYPGVHIPFADWLAPRIRGAEPSILRHFDRLLAATEGSAWLYHRQRQRDDVGRLIATVADYGHAQSVMGRAFRVATANVTEKQQEAWKALNAEFEALSGDDGWVTMRAVARKLGRSPGTASKHLKALKKKGYAVQEGKGGSWRPDSTPHEGSALPSPEEVAAAFPHLASAWVHPVSGEVTEVFAGTAENGATMTTGATSESEGPSPTPSPSDERGDTPEAQPRFDFEQIVASVAPVASNPEGNAHTPLSEEREWAEV